jgi:hypothetical protein
MSRAVSASATARQADWFIARRAERERRRGCERRQVARRRRTQTIGCERRYRAPAVVRRSERRRSFLRERRRTRQAQGAMREQPLKQMCVGPSKYELQGPTV